MIFTLGDSFPPFATYLKPRFNTNHNTYPQDVDLNHELFVFNWYYLFYTCAYLIQKSRFLTMGIRR